MHSNSAKDSATITECVSVSDDAYARCPKTGVTLAAPRKYEIKYKNVITMLYIHLAALYGAYLCFTSAKWATIIFADFMFLIGGFGITGGAHRLWTHKTYKAKLPFEIFVMLCNCLAHQQSVFYWARDHRLHHKYSDTDADPHNARRGFFYSHIGWLITKKSDLVKERGKTIDVSDLENNPVLKFQRKYAFLLFSMICYILPTVIPIMFWSETLNNAWHVNMFRYALTFNASSFVNSVAHIYGNRPYDKNIIPTQNLFVSFLTGGEGFHNYHHAFPWDYRAAEIGNNYLNSVTLFLNLSASLGWVYDLKTVEPDMIIKKAQRIGDGTNCWGFNQI